MFVSDDAFPLRDNIMEPFSHRQLTHEKEIFNNRLSRNVVEASFGKIAQMWRLLQRPMDVQPNVASNIVKAITVLHNFVIIKEPDRAAPCENTCDQFQAADTSNQTGFKRPTFYGNSRAMKVRETLMNYFISPAGSLPWQNDVCVIRPS
ncbi:hypothetical protein RRG08_030543 [Elysia crispata]|uniref:DDE Tnp4 domain-containing protein n=1 Tax=Elysia crispata TaxID=231223 RepID=A0AAE0YI46_9GAST|nr:hypothetical protein RRG08_030543 [Elysia crispata]